jgi:hypothetical protein
MKNLDFIYLKDIQNQQTIIEEKCFTNVLIKLFEIVFNISYLNSLKLL